MKQKTIKVLKVEPKKHPVVAELTNTLTELQKAVSIGLDNIGLIEIIDLEPDVCLLCNEEGKLNGMEGNRRVGNDIICGVFYVVGSGKNGNLKSLPDKDIERYMKRFWNIEYYNANDIAEKLFMYFTKWDDKDYDT